MPKISPSLALSLLSLVALVGTFALLILGREVPSLIETIDTVTLSAVAGAAMPAIREPAAASAPTPEAP